MNPILPALPYGAGSLEPWLSRHTLAAHYEQHHARHVDAIRRLVEGTVLQTAGLEEIMRESSAGPDRELFHAAFQVWSHSFYWSSLHPAGGGAAHGPIAVLIEDDFGNYSAFRQQFVATAERCSDDWLWLVLDEGRLRIRANVPPRTSAPLLAIDMAEHAYQPDYEGQRRDYVDAVFSHLIDWDFANRNLAAAWQAPAATHPRWLSAVRAAGAKLPMPGAARRR